MVNAFSTTVSGDASLHCVPLSMTGAEGGADNAELRGLFFQQ